jgi:hypothetical protein
VSRGFSLVEALVAMTLTLIVTGTALALVAPASRVSSTQPEVVDVQQRARVAAETIARDLASAGAGMFTGASRGVLTTAIPAVLPRRLGADRGDGPDVARDTAITLLSVPLSAAETSLAAPISSASLTLTMNPSPNCGAAPLCGLTAGRDVLVRDDTGHFDVFRITRVAGAVGTLRHHGQDLAWIYPAGAAVTEVVTRTFDYDPVARQLRQYDGDQSDQPAVDHLSRVSFSFLAAAPGSDALVPLPLTSFTDGPWIGAGTTRFDAHLLNVRAVRVTVTAEAADTALAARVAPVTVSLDVTPRSMSVGR